MLDILKVIFIIPFLIYSCYSDIRTRRVSNNLWLVMLSGIVFFVMIDFLSGGLQYLKIVIFSVIFIFIFVYILFQIGTFGGADAKSLIMMSIILPVYPEIHMLNHDFPINPPLIDIFALGIFGNAVLLTIVVPIGLAMYNIIKLGVKIDKPLYIFIGYKSKISNLSNKHIKLIQDYEESDGRIKSRFKRGGVEVNEKTISNLHNLYKKCLIGEYVWVTPSLPFMIPITVGFFVAIFYGDLIFELVKFFIFRI
jgi:preflagellin peptidase FlaK